MFARHLRWLIPATLGIVSVDLTSGSCAGAEESLSSAQTALSRGQIETAVALLAVLARSYPDCGPAVLLHAQVQAGRGKAKEAEELFLRACSLAPQQSEPFFQLGIFYDSRQQHGRAANQFRKVLKLTPGDPQAYDYLALSLEALGEFDQAEAAYRMGLARNRGPRFDPMLHYNYGRFLMKQNRLDDAGRQLDQAIELVPDVRASPYERAKLNEMLGDLKGTRSHGERALALADPGGVILDMQVHYLLARVYRALGETELAAKYTALSQEAEIPLSVRRRSSG